MLFGGMLAGFAAPESGSVVLLWEKQNGRSNREPDQTGRE